MPNKRPKKEIIKKEEVCPECGNAEFNYNPSNGEVSCRKCGLIIKENLIDNGPGWRAYNTEQMNERAHVGPRPTGMRHDFGLNSEIDWRNNKISSKNRAQWYRLRKLQKRSRVSGSRERNLAFALNDLSRKASNLRLYRDVRELAAHIYRKSFENNLIRGRTIECVVSASIYIACRTLNIPRTLAEIVEVSACTKKEIGRTYRNIARKLQIDLNPTSPIDYIPRFATELDLSDRIQIKAIEMINQYKEKGLAIGKGPNGIAAAALYLASHLLGERKTQRDIAEVAGVSEVIVRSRYKELAENLNVSAAI